MFSDLGPNLCLLLILASLSPLCVAQDADLVDALPVNDVSGTAEEEDDRPPPEIIVTALRREAEEWRVPYSVSTESGEKAIERGTRSMADAVQVFPSVMAQKTGYGQGSPYIRGFTGFHSLYLIDGIRLNNSVFRSGPNQYFNTIDPLMVGRIELVRGPSSVLYGSDAVGGVINVFSRKRKDYETGTHWSGSVYSRYASAERSFVERIEVEHNAGSRVGFVGGVTHKNFGDLRGGRDTGVQANTAYKEIDGDFRLDVSLRDDIWLTVAWQHVAQDDVPRTHKTIYSVPFHGTDVGSELRRDLDQTRDLGWTRLSIDDFAGFFDRADVTLSTQRQDQERDRLRTGARRDISGFTVNTFGALAEFEKDGGGAGVWTIGAEYYRDNVDSFRKDFVGGTLTLEEIQGPVGDRAEYGLLGTYVQNELKFGDFDLVTGVRYTRASAHADEVDNPQVGGSDPTTPGNVLAISERFSATVGSLRGIYHFDDGWNVFGGLSQGFRAPNLSDLTSFDATSAVEVPSPGLDPEYFLAFEVGARGRYDGVDAQVALWKTLIDDMIVQSPTGAMLGGTPVVRKHNAGDGYIHGVEGEISLALTETWTAMVGASWMEGRVDQFILPGGFKVSRPVSRLQPLTGRLGLLYEPAAKDCWLLFETVAADNQDKLALRDETDSSRIPVGGTPGYTVFNVRAGIDVTDDLTVTAAVENITDKDYRIHGSGVNEAGTNFITSLRYSF